MFCLKFLCLCLWTNLTLIEFIFVFCVFALVFSILWLFVQMSPFKRSALKGGSSKGKELVIDVDNLSPRSRRTRSTTEAFDLDKFRSYAIFQDYEIYFSMLCCWLKGLLIRHLFLKQKSLNGLPPRIGTTFFPTLMMHMRTW